MGFMSWGGNIKRGFKLRFGIRLNAFSAFFIGMGYLLWWVILAMAYILWWACLGMWYMFKGMYWLVIQGYRWMLYEPIKWLVSRIRNK